jgi:nucleoside-diphosphate-sugar epimerase
MKSILVTGGAGYAGGVLIPRLLARGHAVTVYDIGWYGDAHLARSPRLTLIQGDIRDTLKLGMAFAGIDTVLNLACVSNDPSYDLDPNLSKSINYDCFEPMVLAARQSGVKRFVYCSSSSVYGISEKPEVTETHELVPVSHYNLFKALCEPILFRNAAPGFDTVVIRPATLCGYSPRQRLDLSVNILTNFAVNKGEITVFGGAQMRPNLHIEDMARAYETLIDAPADKIRNEIFNCGWQNLTISRIAEIVRDVVKQEMPGRPEIKITTTPSNDPRSYHINSDKIKRVLGFEPIRTVEDAVRDLVRAFRDGKLPGSFDDDRYFNVKRMKAAGAK